MPHGRRGLAVSCPEIRPASTGKRFEAKECRSNAGLEKRGLLLRAIVEGKLRPHFDLDTTVRRRDELRLAGHFHG